MTKLKSVVLFVLASLGASAAIASLHRATLPYICIAVDPLTAGVFASFANLAGRAGLAWEQPPADAAKADAAKWLTKLAETTARSLA